MPPKMTMISPISLNQGKWGCWYKAKQIENENGRVPLRYKKGK